MIFAPIMGGGFALALEYLVVGGGGGGYGGGGGGGQMLTGSLTINGAQVVTVGAGGAPLSLAPQSSLGSLVTALGGGFGGSTNGGQGGSGGGGGFFSPFTAGAANGTGTTAGGTGNATGGAGGGGAGVAGASASGTNGGNGGNGLQSAITGTLTYYAGGGGGSGVGGTMGSGGLGGGNVGVGNGPSNGAANTGGGGGGINNINPSTGGSGIVILRYLSTIPTMTGGYITRTGGYIVHTFLNTYGSGTSFDQLAGAGTNGNDANCKLLMHYDGPNGFQIFTDLSPSAHTNGFVGTPAISSSAPKFGDGSCTFAGTERIGYGGTPADFTGTGDFTYEAWIKTTTIAADGGLLRCIFSTNPLTTTDGTMNIVINNTGSGPIAIWQRAAGVTSQLLLGTINAATGAWVHVAVTRASGTLRLFVNGVADGSVAFPLSLTAAQMNIGGDGGGAAGRFLGNIDEVRVSNIARWTSGFTPPTAAYY